MMQQLLSEDLDNTNLDTEVDVRPTPVPTLSPDPPPDLNNTSSKPKTG